MSSPQPVDAVQMRQVRIATENCLRQASRLFGLAHEPVRVNFDLVGRCAGQYRVNRDGRCIRYNPYIFARYYSDSLNNTVPHEVAHCIVDRLYGLRRVRPHGVEWRQVMRALGARPQVTARYDLDGLPQRCQQRFRYHCACREHALSAIRHNRIIKRQARYSCRVCGTLLVRLDR